MYLFDLFFFLNDCFKMTSETYIVCKIIYDLKKVVVIADNLDLLECKVIKAYIVSRDYCFISPPGGTCHFKFD